MAHRSMESNRYSALCEDESEPEGLRIEMASLPMQNFEQGPIHKVDQNSTTENDLVPSKTNLNVNYPLASLTNAGKSPADDDTEIKQTALNNLVQAPSNISVGDIAEGYMKNPLSQVPGKQPLLQEDMRIEPEDRIKPASEAEAEERIEILRSAFWDRDHEYVYLGKPKLGPWETITQGLDKYDREMCEAWIDELTTILTFTGLFSAAATAFCVESLKLLSQNPADTTNTLLMAISQQLNNSSSPVTAFTMINTFTPNTYDVQINVLYFVSLTLALSISSVCILGKQWIREYQKDIAASPCDVARVRQMRYNSLQTWKVPQIIAALPVILLIALMLFFAGLLVQLWNIDDHTTAGVVSVIVVLTILFIIVTTIVPAYYSLRDNQTRFTPFRSPQSWMFFSFYRRFRAWCYRTFDVGGPTATLSGWAEGDLLFLTIETGFWFEHQVSSVHRVLRWVLEVLRNSSEMEKALLWCLQSRYYPKDLIASEDELSRHVLLGSNGQGTSDDLNRVYYDYSSKNEGICGIGSPAGRHQAELVLRSAHCAIDDVSDDVQKSWDMINYSCEKLWYCGIFNEYSGQEIVHHQHILQDQVALLLERILSISLLPSHLFDWDDIISLLLKTRHNSSSPLSRRITPYIINRRLPTWIRTHKSASLLHAIGSALYSMPPELWEYTTELFVELDKIFMEMCSEPEAIHGLDEGSIEKWGELRSLVTKPSMIGRTGDPSSSVHI